GVQGPSGCTRNRAFQKHAQRGRTMLPCPGRTLGPVVELFGSQVWVAQHRPRAIVLPALEPEPAALQRFSIEWCAGVWRGDPEKRSIEQQAFAECDRLLDGHDGLSWQADLEVAPVCDTQVAACSDHFVDSVERGEFAGAAQHGYAAALERPADHKAASAMHYL